MPQLDFFVWFDTLLTTSNLFTIFTIVGVAGSVLVVKRSLGTKSFWVWYGRGVVGHRFVRFVRYVSVV